MVNLGGTSEKCTACAKTVYLTEKIVVEDKEDKKTFHKLCLKCTHCKITLNLGTYASMNGVFYCKPHFKQLFATKGNYDEGFGKSKHSEKWTPQANTAPSSFIKVEETKVSSDKKETPTHIANRFGGAAEKCAVCNTTVYLTEKTVIEDKEDKKVLHKNCLKCKHCNITLNLGTYASMNGVFYCKPHFKQLFATKGNYDESFGLNKVSNNDKWTPVVNTAPGGSFVPVEKAAESSKNTNQANPDIAKKFTAVGSEKCDACGKAVYLTEKITVEETDSKRVLHKACLKCSKCGVVQTLGTMVSLDGIIYCKPHFKELYATKGNLDEGFGKAKHTDKWENNPFPYLEKDSNYVPSVDKLEAETTTNNEDDVKRFQNINVDETAVTKKFESTSIEQEPEPEQQQQEEEKPVEQEEQKPVEQEEEQVEVAAAVEEEKPAATEEEEVSKHEVEQESKVEESVAAEEEN